MSFSLFGVGVSGFLVLGGYLMGSQWVLGGYSVGSHCVLGG